MCWIKIYLDLEKLSSLLDRPFGEYRKVIMMAEESLLNSVLTDLDMTAEILDLDPSCHEVLKHPQRTLTVSVPVRMDTELSKSSPGTEYITAMLEDPARGGYAIILMLLLKRLRHLR